MLLLFSVKELNDHQFVKELLIFFTVRVFVNVYQCVCLFFFGFEGGMWYLIVSAPDQCLSFYF